MTVEARYKIFGIHIATNELFPLDGEMYVRFDWDKTNGDDKDSYPVTSVTTFRVLSENEIAVFLYKPEAEDPHILKRGKPTVLTYDEINEAKLRTSSLFVRGDVCWKPRT